MRAAASSPASSQQLVAGGASLDGLRASANKDPKGAIKEVAKQFEALFMQELMKSMRATTMKDDMLASNGGEMMTGMLDQQYATSMTGQPGGLADAIARQLERQMGVSPAAGSGPAIGGLKGLGAGATGAASSVAGLNNNRARLAASYGVPAATGATAGSATGATAAPSTPSRSSSATGRAQDFIQAHSAAAQEVAAQSGIPARFMLAQAAHETGWGRREIRGADGTNSNNLFGIKAGGSWTGPTVTTTTTEVINGQPQKVQAKFRAYATPEESFRDYARLIGNSPRYAGVVRAGNDATAFAQGLQRAGYATDPQYAAKLGRVIETTARLQREIGAVAQAQPDRARAPT
ncbi:flagellar rod assembly protein/muramidase FlgJ [Leptothrix cholodnii SP-6]|uniref:Peptidoglycan hydrolase FlgJ n=1 Tax=Leptothrix cholodnii (strain ATCC 51168 / LMG 8142 / SP-6) TaxID=395495 RepID=B1XWJ0_LEPCP|nr:flagellar assembly peptidoglycan hydrolase FlgJ [Leptothrix cholodnii]ACB34991.1 flagellar rod assembly protein/muramidase FlgJ [Leptothrix cholodnii SP-6]